MLFYKKHISEKKKIRYGTIDFSLTLCISYIRKIQINIFNVSICKTLNKKITFFSNFKKKKLYIKINNI